MLCGSRIQIAMLGGSAAFCGVRQSFYVFSPFVAAGIVYVSRLPGRSSPQAGSSAELETPSPAESCAWEGVS